MLEMSEKMIGAKIKCLREVAGFSQTQLAEYLKVDQSLISKIEKGERKINVSTVGKLASLFCCPIESLVSNEKSTFNFSIAFRANTLENKDLESISIINKIALNQFEMDSLLRGVANAK